MHNYVKIEITDEQMVITPWIPGDIMNLVHKLAMKKGYTHMRGMPNGETGILFVKEPVDGS